MKATKIQIIALCLMFILPFGSMAQTYSSYPYESGKKISEGTVYYLPKTDLVIKFQVKKTTRTKGIYADNAYLLGIDNAALKNGTTYQIVGVDIMEKTSADLDKCYILSADKNINVDKTSMGTLRSISVKNQKAQNTDNSDRTPRQCPKQEGNHRPDMPLGPNNNDNSLMVRPTYEKVLLQEGLLTKYPQMSAEKVVAEIKRLRDKQLEILTGTTEGTYMNTTVDYMYKQIDEIISSYVALFTGVESSTMEEYVFVITPQKPIILEEDLVMPVCKFSTTQGLMDLNSKQEGTRINATIHSFLTSEDNNKMASTEYLSDKQKSKIESEGAGVYYLNPQMVRLSLQGTDVISTTKMVNLLQYGNIGYTTSHSSNILFNPHTSEIINMW